MSRKFVLEEGQNMWGVSFSDQNEDPWPKEETTAVFVFLDNVIGYANRMSLVNQIPRAVNVTIGENRFSHSCDCMLDLYVKSVTGHSGTQTERETDRWK